MSIRRLYSSVAMGALVASVLPSVSASAPAPDVVAEANRPMQLEEVTVTARRREESLQHVPDAVTALTATAIESAGIQQFSDFAALTPNLNFQDGRAYRSGFLNVSMRGIGNGQEGYPSVAYVVDGVPAESTDALNSGTLVNIERIEVLRGPQSALYGFNAIAGAINVITKRPENEWAYKARVAYGNGPDRRIAGTAAGAIVPDRALLTIAASYRDDDGRISSASNGIDLDFIRQTQVNARLLLTPTDALQIDIGGSYVKEHNGSTYQAKVPDESYIDNFDSEWDARRGFAGVDDRRLSRVAARVRWETESVVLTSVTSYSDVDQAIASGLCYDDPSDPAIPSPVGGASCLFGPAFGDAAAPGQPIDDFFDSRDDSRTFIQDLRLESAKDGAWTWMIGASYLDREAIVGFDAGLFLAPDATKLLLYPSWNRKEDSWWGVYGQVTWKATDRLELTLAARHDDQDYRNTSYTDHTLSTIIQVPSEDGTLVDTQKEKGSEFQPKGQVSYNFTDDVMAYVTVSRGYRAGYFLSGSFTLPETTTNYEVGLKSTGWNQRIVANVAAFHIDYSHQQFSTVIPEPPFRVAVIIPETRINGIEFETTVLAVEHVTFGLGLGYLDAEVKDGTRAPAAPRFNANGSVDVTLPLSGGWSTLLHADARYNSSQYLATGNTQEIPAKTYLNARIGMQTDHYEVAAFIRNATDERQQAIASASFAGGYLLYQNEPRTYGIEFTASF